MHALKLLLAPSNRLRSLESVHDNIFWRGAAPRISVCVPAYRRDVSPLMHQLSQCAGAGLLELIIVDDGSCDHDLLASMQTAAGQARLAIRIVSTHDNRGCTAARNAAMTHARAEWMLLLDADMQPDSARFIEAYLDAIDQAGGAALIVGGTSLHAASMSRPYALHRQARKAECLPSRIRTLSPARHVRLSNVLVHRAVLEKCPIDESLAGSDWAGAAWGLCVHRQFPIVHIDNTATHLGLTSAEDLMGKYSRSLARLALVVKRRPDALEAIPLVSLAQRLRAVPFRKSFRRLAGDVASSEKAPMALRGCALRTWRTLVLAEAL